MRRLILLSSILILSQIPLFAQTTIEQTYDGGWASTFWKFEFTKDGKFKRTSRGHFGNTVKTGKYKIFKDTLEITEGYQNTAGTINQFYLIQEDSCIVDIRLRYAYCILDKNQKWQYEDERKREIKYPQTTTNNSELIKDLDSVLSICFNSPIVTKHYKFDLYKERQPFIRPYYELNEASQRKFTIGGKEPIFKKKENDNKDFFIEISDINQNSDEINVEFKIRKEVVTFLAYFNKKAGKWALMGDISEYNF